jgi:hypothetical protein
MTLELTDDPVSTSYRSVTLVERFFDRVKVTDGDATVTASLDRIRVPEFLPPQA